MSVRALVWDLHVGDDDIQRVCKRFVEQLNLVRSGLDVPLRNPPLEVLPRHVVSYLTDDDESPPKQRGPGDHSGAKMLYGTKTALRTGATGHTEHCAPS
jgi:hypothetical protein